MDYYLGTNGELYHWGLNKGKPREDHKYIKREWKKGKWVYTYPVDNSKKKPAPPKPGLKRTNTLYDRGSKALSSTRKTSTTPWVSDEYKKEVAYNSQKNQYPGNKTSSNSKTGNKTSAGSAKVSKEYQEETAYNSQKNVYPQNTSAVSSSKTEKKKTEEKRTLWSAIGDYLNDRRKEWTNAKALGDKKESDEAAKNGMVSVDSKSLFSKTKTETYGPLSNATATIKSRGKIEQFLDTAKEFVKDRFGFDERDEADAALAKSKRLSELRSVKHDEWVDALFDSERDSVLSPAEREAKRQEADRLQKEYEWLSSESRKAAEASGQASREYDKTVLGKVEAAKEWVDDLWFDVSYGTEKIMKEIRDAGGVAYDAIESAAWELEDGAKEFIGINKKEYYEFLKDAVIDERKYENSPNPAMREGYASLVESCDKAREEYKKSPIGVIDSGREWIEDLFWELGIR